MDPNRNVRRAWVVFAVAAMPVAASVEVVQPANGATVFSNPGEVDVQVRAGPLAPGESVELWVDGAPVPPPSRSKRFELAGMPRGAHSVRAVILDASGSAVASSAPVSFYVWKASRLFPNRRG